MSFRKLRNDERSDSLRPLVIPEVKATPARDLASYAAEMEIIHVPRAIVLSEWLKHLRRVASKREKVFLSLFPEVK